MAAQLEDVQPDKGAASKRTLQIITVLVPAIAGILGTFITVLPQLRNKDAAIGNLEQQVMALKSNLVPDSKGKAAADAAKRLNIMGMITDATGKPMGGAEVLLVPQNKPKHIGYTGKDGTFRFPDMPDERYRIVVREANSRNVNVGNMDEDLSEIPLEGAAKITYRFEK